jgi:lipopolysaccharide biosynthesis glycosyltransferase
MNIVLCADQSVLPGLHVAAYSLLDRIGPAVKETRFTIFSDTLGQADIHILRQTLNVLNKPFNLELRNLATSAFSGFPQLNGSVAPYFRLLAAQVVSAERFLYVDADTLCDVDVSVMEALEMNNAPAAWVPEAPMPRAVDRIVAEQLGNVPTEFYFNSGVLLVNGFEWRRQRITEQAMDYSAKHNPAFHDQSALNCVMHGKALALDAKFNCISNMRKNWPLLRQPYGEIGRLVHFVDYPKPWDWLGEWLHPQYRLWRSVLDRTAMNGFRSSHHRPTRKFPCTAIARSGYKKAIKDRLLFASYSRGWLKRLKGVPML